MNRGGPGLAFAFILASGGAFAQDNGDAMARLRACSLLTPAERTECLEALSRDITRPSIGATSGSRVDARNAATKRLRSVMAAMSGRGPAA